MRAFSARQDTPGPNCENQPPSFSLGSQEILGASFGQLPGKLPSLAVGGGFDTWPGGRLGPKPKMWPR